ncbi:hypothetical protein PS2_006529 [Malus domestica]
MACPSDLRLDLNVGEYVDMSSPDNIWRPFFLSATSPLAVGDSVMKNDITTTVVARNLFTPKDNRIISKWSDELAVQDSLAFSVQCAVCGLCIEYGPTPSCSYLPGRILDG